MATVLHIGPSLELMKTRKLLLERAGHTVLSATHVRDVTDACSSRRIDVAVICQTVIPAEKQHALEVVREHCPDAKILSLYTRGSGKSLSGADAWMEVPPETPSELADHVSALAASVGSS